MINKTLEKFKQNLEKLQNQEKLLAKLDKKNKDVKKQLDHEHYELSSEFEKTTKEYEKLAQEAFQKHFNESSQHHLKNINNFPDQKEFFDKKLEQQTSNNVAALEAELEYVHQKQEMNRKIDTAVLVHDKHLLNHLEAQNKLHHEIKENNDHFINHFQHASELDGQIQYFNNKIKQNLQDMESMIKRMESAILAAKRNTTTSNV